MIVVSQTRSHVKLLAGIAAIGSGILLAGCEFQPHDDLTKPPSSMPVPASVQAAQAKAAQESGHSVVPVPTEKEMGMPIYPNATVYVDPTGHAIKPELDGESTMATLSTRDTLDRVVEFYKQALVQTDGQGKTGPASVREENQNGKQSKIITGNDGEGNIMMAIVHENSGHTVMELMHTRIKAIPSSVSGIGDHSSSTTHEGDLPSTGTGSTSGTSTGGSSTGGTTSTSGTTSSEGSVVRPYSSSPGASGTSSSDSTNQSTSTSKSRMP